MMSMIPTESVILHEKTLSGADDFGHETWTETDATIDGVIVGEASTSDVESAIEVYGKKLSYTLGIPKGDTHNWEDANVTIRGKLFHTIGIPLQITHGGMPTWWQWDKKIGVEIYE